MNLFKKKTNKSGYKTLEQYKELEKENRNLQKNVDDLLFEIIKYKEKLYDAEQKNIIINSKNKVIKAIEERILNDCKNTKDVVDTKLIIAYIKLLK